MSVSADRIIPHPTAHGRPAPGAGLLAVRDGADWRAAAQPDADAADAYLRLTAHLLLQAERQGVRSVGVTSAFAGEGKSTAAMNLAVCLGRTRGRRGRVLLVDADAHQRSLSLLLGGAAAQADAEGAPRRHPLLLATSFEGVDLLTAPDPQDGLTLYAPNAWRTTLAELTQRYEHVIVDCPSVLGHPAGPMLRDCVDALVMVVRAGRTTRQDVERALAGSSRRVLGVILNGADGRPLDDAGSWR